MCLPQFLWRKIISLYNSDNPATHPKVISPVICSASMIASLNVGATAIAESAMCLFGLYTTLIILYATISDVRDLSIMKCSCFLNLLFDDSKCVHLISPEILGVFNPVPSVVCVPVMTTFWC